jgi:hypothetical protein
MQVSFFIITQKTFLCPCRQIIESHVPFIVSRDMADILALAATGVETDHNGGFERNMFGSHVIKMNDRTYHFLPTAKAN